jgi:hypothetical protein
MITGDSDKGAACTPLVMYVFTQPVIACRICGFVFSLLRYEAHLPSVTVRDENGGQRTVSTSAVVAQSPDKRCGRRGMMTRCIAMSVGKVSDGTQIMVDILPKLQPHLETNHVERRGCSRERMVLSNQCCSGSAL